MGIIKKLTKLAKHGGLGLGPQIMAGGNPIEGTPAQAMFGGLAHHLAAEDKQHAQHKHVHHHYHKKKK
jgi:hypothetical protein